MALGHESLTEINRIRRMKGRHRLTRAQYAYVRGRGLSPTIWTSLKARGKKRHARRRYRPHRP